MEKKRRSSGLFSKTKDKANGATSRLTKSVKKVDSSKKQKLTEEQTEQPLENYSTGYEDLTENVEMNADNDGAVVMSQPNIPITEPPQSSFQVPYPDRALSPAITVNFDENERVAADRSSSTVVNGVSINPSNAIRQTSDYNTSANFGPKVFFINSPLLDQNTLPANFDILQNNIVLLQNYVLPLNDTPIESTKRCFMIDSTNATIGIDKLDFDDNINHLFEYKLNFSNMNKIINMFYGYYIKLIQNLFPIANIGINVNYTVGSTDLTQIVTHFINFCVFQTMQNFYHIINSVEGGHLIDGQNQSKLEAEIKDKQKKLTSYYNSKLHNLQAFQYYKYTVDNDSNTVTTSGKSENILSPLYHVKVNVMKVNKTLIYS
ncbi:orf39 [Sucra jujuba nucleopolyhedrovirus]|uniref:Orf39 n=1 Tax=Sucra jujuba nucleopolyhedrovirus TaxID=1563660 RepID=A0A097P8X7_9ABAC|nr:orf39 [Sucra jujuba nucleopolyhedrovirus]AIU41278.1 orf39 [Sucra jujuba nucleopolyhedrovirus]